MARLSCSVHPEQLLDFVVQAAGPGVPGDANGENSRQQASINAHVVVSRRQGLPEPASAGRTARDGLGATRS